MSKIWNDNFKLFTRILDFDSHQMKEMIQQWLVSLNPFSEKLLNPAKFGKKVFANEQKFYLYGGVDGHCQIEGF